MSLISFFKRLLGLGPKSSPKDRTLVCLDCNKSFVFDEGEQQFFKSKGFSDPKRCPDCRKKIKSQIKKRRRGGRGGGGGGEGGGSGGGFQHSSRRRGFRRRRDSIIDGDSPYADVRY